MNAICIVVDGLHAGFLGCYGNSWIQTPAIDRLAVQSFLFDQALIQSPQLEQIYHGYWQGLPAMSASANLQTVLLTDECALPRHELSAQLNEIVQLPAAELRTAAASDETHLAQVFSAAADWLEKARQPFCLWLHTQGLHGAWDSPSALREQYAEEEDFKPPTFVEPPVLNLSADYDPDQLLGIRWAYAAQVTVLDRCLEAFLEWWDTQPAARETLFVLLGARSYPLGEHGRVGMAEIPATATSLHEELIHVPCLARLPDGVGAADRSQALIHPADLAWTLAEWFQLASDGIAPWGQSWLPLVRGGRHAIRDRACMLADEGEQAIRTPAWHLIVPGSKDLARKLYVKPDDRWEANDVTDRCAKVADDLLAALAECNSAGERGTPLDVTPLADVLMRGFEA